MLLSITPHHHYSHHHHRRHNHFKPPVVHCHNPNVSNLRRVSNESGACEGVSSAAAVAAAIRKASSSPVEFVERMEEEKLDKLPSCDFQTLCVEQLDLFRRIVHPDANLSTQMHSLTPFGADILSKGMVEDNMTWNFVAGLTVAREILESYGCVVRVISPRCMEAPLGAGGTRVEIWLPSFTSSPDGLDGSPQAP